MKLPEGLKPLKKYGALILVVLTGLALLLWPKGTGPPIVPAGEAAGDAFQVDILEKQLGLILSDISGAGSVEVLLTLKTDMEVVVVQDTDTRNRRGGTSDTWDEETKTKTVLTGGVPIVLKRIYPQFQGALVVCDGASEPKVHAAILDAVTSVTGLRSDSVSVAQRKHSP